MYRMMPDPNVARRAQILRLDPARGAGQRLVFALKLALHELQRLIERGLSEDDFEMTRNYLMKNVYVMTKTQDQQLGYALDSRWYGTGEFTAAIRSASAALTLDQVNAVICKHLSTENLSVVMVTPDAADLRNQLLAPELHPRLRRAAADGDPRGGSGRRGYSARHQAGGDPDHAGGGCVRALSGGTCMWCKSQVVIEAWVLGARAPRPPEGTDPSGRGARAPGDALVRLPRSIDQAPIRRLAQDPERHPTRLLARCATSEDGS